MVDYVSLGNLPIGDFNFSTGEKLGAQFTLENVIGSSITSQRGVFTRDPNFNPSLFLDDNFDDEEDENRRKFALIHTAGSAEEAYSRLDVDEKFRRAREIRNTMGLWESLWTGAIAGITDPIVLATTAVPVIRAGLTFGKAATRLGGLAAGEQTAIEGILHSQQRDRTLTESALNIGANAVLGGVLGGVGSRFYNSSRQFSSPEGDQEIQATLKGVFSAEGDEVLSGMPKPTNRAELEAMLAATDIVGRGFFRGAGATELNPIARTAAQQASMEARIIMQELSGHNFLTNANRAGDVGTASTESVAMAVERATGRFAGEDMRILTKAYKDYTKAEGRSLVMGWDDYLNKVGEYYRSYDPDMPELTPQWARDVIPKLEKTHQAYEDHLIRGGWFNDILESADSVKAKLEKAEVKKAKARDKARYDDEIADLKERLALRERHDNGDLQATRELIADLHGDKRYLTQSHNVEKARANRTGWLETMTRAERAWYDRRYVELGGEKTAKGRLFDKKMKKMFGVTRKKDGTVVDNQAERLNAVYDEISSLDDAFNLGGIDAVAPSQSKARQLRIDQDEAKEYLKNNFMDLTNAHYSSVLPQMEMKNRGLIPGSAEMNARMAQVNKEIEMLMEGADAKRVKELIRAKQKIEHDIQNVSDLIRHTNYKNVTQRQRDIGFAITQFNAVRQLGAMLIPSFGDAAGIIAKTGMRNVGRAVGPLAKGIRNADIPARDASRMVGIVETVMASRMHALQNSAELGINQGTGARMMGRISQQFYKATGILWWNQGMKEIAVLGWGDALLRAASAPSKVSKADKMWMLRDGWDDAKLARLNEVYKVYGIKQTDGSTSRILDTGRIYREWSESTPETRAAMDQAAQLANEYNATLLKHAERAVVTPGAGDFPSFITRHPFLKLLGQYKGFGAASINKTTIPMVQGMMAGDANMAFGFMGLVALGTGAYTLRQLMYDRDISENWQTLAYEGLLRGGALGLYSDGLAISQKMSQNWWGLGDAVGIETPSRYYARGLLTDILGPTAGLAEDLGYSIHAASGLAKGEELSQADLAKGARMIPFNNLFYLRAVLENLDNDS